MHLGFQTAVLAFMVGYGRIVAGWRWRATLAAAAGFTILYHLVFVTGAGAKLPKALIFDVWAWVAGLFA